MLISIITVPQLYSALARVVSVGVELLMLAGLMLSPIKYVSRNTELETDRRSDHSKHSHSHLHLLAFFGISWLFTNHNIL